MLHRLSLRSILFADAVLTGVAGLLMAAGAWFLDDFLNLPTNLIWISGIVLMAYTGFLWMIRNGDPINPMHMQSSAAINLAWGVGCIVLLVAEWTNANAIGVGFILLQVAVVLLFAALLLNATQRESRAGNLRLTAN